MIDYVEFNRRIDVIKTLYRQYNIKIKRGQGLFDILLEADKIAKAVNYPDDNEKIKLAVESFHYTWALSETLETCVSAGWDVSNHLKQITTGTVDYGEPASGNDTKKIFYKDFECELFIGSVLIKKGLKPELLDDPNDPKGDIKLGNVIAEVKHPNSTGQIKKLMWKFNREMRNNNSFGVFVVGVEDMFNIGDVYYFNDVAHFDTWEAQKNQEIEQFGLQKTIPMAQSLPRIMGLVQTSTKIFDIAGITGLRRFGNSVLYERVDIPSDDLSNAEAIVKAFNPNPPVRSLQC